MKAKETNIHSQTSQSVASILAFLVVGTVIGASASWGLLAGSVEKASPFVDSILGVALPMAGAFAASLVVVLPTTYWLVKRFLSSSQATLASVVSRVGATARSLDEGDRSTARENAELAFREVVAWYAPIAARRWIVQTALALLIAFGGLIGTALVFRQTALLSEQNRKISEQIDLLTEQNRKLDLQTITADAQRRSELTAELFRILAAVSELRGNPPDPPLLARITAFSHSAFSYWVIEHLDEGEDGQLVRRASRRRSPERGHLLVGLALNRSKQFTQGVIFDDADARGAELEYASLFGNRMQRADFSRARLIGASFTNVRARGTDFNAADLERAAFIEADLEDANFKEATLLETQFNNAKLYRAKFVDCFGMSADFSYAELSKADFRGARPGKVIMRGAMLLFAEFTGVIFQPDTDWTDAVVGSEHPHIQDELQADAARAHLPRGFPRGWTGPPSGWVIVEKAGVHVLRRRT